MYHIKQLSLDFSSVSQLLNVPTSQLWVHWLLVPQVNPFSIHHPKLLSKARNRSPCHKLAFLPELSLPLVSSLLCLSVHVFKPLLLILGVNTI